MKRIYCVTTAAVFLIFAGCHRETGGPTNSQPQTDMSTRAAAESDAVIGVSILTKTNPFFVQLAEAMVQEGKKHNFKLIVTSGENNMANQKNQVNEFITTQVDAIVLCPCDSRAVGTSIAAANKAGIPVFTADIASLAKDAKVVCHVATDNYGGGKLAGQTMAELLGGSGKVAIVDFPEVESVNLRTKGFREVIDKIPDIEIVGSWPGGGDRVKAFKAAEDILQTYTDLDAFFAVNDPSGVGVARALDKAGKADRIKIISFDAQPIGREAVKQGEIYATIVQYPERIGQKVIEAVARYMDAEPVEPKILIPCSLYRKAEADRDPTLRQSE